MDFTLGTIIPDALFEELSIEIKTLFPNNDCYFIGSACINNVEKSDVDFLVLFDEAISYETFQSYRTAVASIDTRLQIMCCFTHHEADLKDLPYVNMQDLTDRRIIDKNDFTDDAFKEYKETLYKHLWKRRKFHRAMIRNK